MNTKKIVILSCVLIFLILILAGLAYDFSFIIQSYHTIFYDFDTGESYPNYTDEQLKLFWSWYDSYYILSIISIILLSVLIILDLYLLMKEIVSYCKHKK